ncbi:MAG: phosphoribosylanthranilate isomerase [Ruminococcus sp.]|jgi:phosphoribosylanthranilate isomerase
MRIPEIKICGLMTERDVRLIHKYEIEYAGIVLFCKSSVRNNPPERAWKLAALLGRNVKKTAVCVSPTPDQVEMIEHMGFDILQVHGELSKEVLAHCHLPIFRAYNVNSECVIPVEEHENIAGYVLDGAVPGQGKTFDWSLAGKFDRRGKKLILAGGLTADNVAGGIAAVSPDIVDVSSYVERKDAPGKDEDKIRKFVETVRREKVKRKRINALEIS